MQINKIALLAAISLVVAFSGPALAEPPQLNIPNEALGGGLIPDGYVKQIRARVDYWLGALEQAQDASALESARNGLIEDYGKYKSPGYHYEYAKQLSARAIAALAKLDGMKAVNLAMALSRVPEVPMQPAFNAMVAHPVAGVRYIGWQSYLDARLAIMGQGEKFTQDMFNTLADRFAKESDAVVFGPMLDMLRIPPTVGTAITDDAVKTARQQCWSILEKAWPTLCQRVLAGNAEMARSCRQGIATLEYYSKNLPDNKKKILQMIVDAMYCAGKAFDAAGAEGTTADNDSQLLLDAESALGRITGIQKNNVARPLGDRNLKERGAAVQLGVLNWVEDLKAQGVTDPKIQPASAASSKPAASAPKAK